MKIYVLLTLFVALFFNLNAQEVAKRAKDTNPIQVGSSIPDGILLNMKGDEITLKNVLSQKPSVIIFYRGGWCPYCNLHLSEMKDIEQEVMELGYQIIAISPDDIKDVYRTVNKNDFNYTLLSDSEGELITKMGLAFKSDFLTKSYAKAKNKGVVLDILPVPSVYVVSIEGKILYVHSDTNYKKRLSGVEVISTIKALK